MGGFIVLSDGRAFALNNRATNVIVQTIAVELPAGELRNWLLSQQSTIVDAAERGDPPMDLNPHMRAVLPPTSDRSGPGWDHQE
jgi:hypothetical protein